MTACPPSTPDTSALAIALDPCSALPEMRLAYYRLISGNVRSQVGTSHSNGGGGATTRQTHYHAANPALLLREIRKLEQMCVSASNPTPNARAYVGSGAFPGGPNGRLSPAGMLPSGWLSRYR